MRMSVPGQRKLPGLDAITPTKVSENPASNGRRFLPSLPAPLLGLVALAAAIAAQIPDLADQILVVLRKQG